MSVASEKVRKAIFAKSNVAPLVGGPGKLTAIYESKAPEDATRPYGIFSRQAPGEVRYNFGVNNALESDLWLFKVIADEDSGTAMEPQELAEDLLNEWESKLGSDLTLAGNTVAWMARFADMPPIEQGKGSGFDYVRGFLMRIGTE
jgi:hypothetical protein